MTGDPDKEYGTNKPPPTGRVQERSKGDTACPSTSQNLSRQHPSWLRDACATRKDSELEWLAKDHPETNPITIKPETASHAAEQFSWVPLPYCSPPGCPFPVKSLALSVHVSPRTIHFWLLDKSPVLGPGRSPLSCNKPTRLFPWLQARILEWIAMPFPQNTKLIYYKNICLKTELPKWLSGREYACQWRRLRSHGFNPWVWKIP